MRSCFETTLLLFLLFALPGCGPEPTFKTKPLSSWRLQLHDKDWKYRRDAVEAIGTIQSGGNTIDDLKAALHDENEQVQTTAMFWLGKIGEPASDAVPELKEFFSSKSAKLQVDSARAIYNINQDSKLVVPILIQVLLVSDVDDFQKDAVNGLGDVGPHATDAVEILVHVLQRPSGDLWATAAVALEKIGEPAAAPVAKLLAQNDGETPTRASVVLESLGQKAVPAVIEILKNPNPKTRANAVQVLWQIKPPPKQAVPALQSLLNDPDEIVRIDAKLTLEYIENGR